MCWSCIWERVSHAGREKAATVICCNDSGWKKCTSTSPENPPCPVAGLSCAPQTPVPTSWLHQAMVPTQLTCTVASMPRGAPAALGLGKHSRWLQAWALRAAASRATAQAPSQTLLHLQAFWACWARLCCCPKMSGYATTGCLSLQALLALSPSSNVGLT